MSSKNGRLIEFDKFRLDVGRRVLWYEDQPVNLALKEIELLSALTENSGEVVSKQELLDRVWGDAFVEESNLSRHIYVLRQMFKKLGASGDYIQTVPQRGYRFAGQVRTPVHRGDLVVEKHTLTQTDIEIQDFAEGSVSRATAGRAQPQVRTAYRPSTRLIFSFCAILLTALLVGGLSVNRYVSRHAGASPIKSIAILPFRTIDSRQDDKKRSLGLADVLITRLSNIKQLTVRPTSEVVNFESQDPVAFAKTIDADSVLDGTIYFASGKIRITARLLRTDDGSTIWTGQFEKPASDELNMQNDIALYVADALALNLSGNEREALGKFYTKNLDAYQLYAQGRIEWNKRTFAGSWEAQRLFKNAIEKDPEFALAYIGLADSAMMGSDWLQANMAIEKALELDPALPEAYATRGFLHLFREWNWRKAEEAFKKSIELNPNYATAHHWYAQLLTIEGRHEEAKTQMRRALEINPLSHNFLADLGQIYYFNHEYKEAEEYCHRALEIYPDFEFAHEYLFQIYLQTGDYDRAVEERLVADKIHGTFANQPDEAHRQLDADLEKKRQAYRTSGIKKFLENRLTDIEDANMGYVYAKIHAYFGEREKALDLLEKAYADKSFLSAFVKADPIFDSLRDEPRYQNILRGMSLAE
ncbi:MAG TPA: tetratricopeptide repeat protein [Pyrinomonadaceae bacterium]|nr:tetratricopeptide repeat protein [Pyrinomonadaceae bacterium]